MRLLTLLLSLVAVSFAAFAQPDNWNSLRQQANGQTVYFNAWGGDPAVNSYLDWVAGEMKQQYGVTVKVVRLADAADAVKRIQSEDAAGRKTRGSVDLLWVNGENFRTLKQAGLLKEGWAWALPNWRYVDQNKPVREDFSQPTDGAEAPWGSAQLMLIGNVQPNVKFPRSADELLAFAKAHPGKLSYPRPPDFTGTAFIEQLFIVLTRDRQALRTPPDAATFQQVTAPLWDYLDKLHPLLWREGKTFPPTPARMDRMLADGELLFSVTFNPSHVDNLIDRKQLPKTAQAFGFEQGMLGNVHFVTIPANANAQAGAQVLANFLMSPEAQIRKANPAIWGDATVLDSSTLPQPLREQLDAQKPVHQQSVPYLAEPHAAWVEALEKEWLQRYGAK
ncbi:ABC transporter substrate-binding protein [Buttiauxella agrestis]|uniref:Periplasmic substrate-binding component of an ABC superfamily transporter n=1 Tax=Buttiauxella agrestis ATCC 33320 TaxID=1006004 RepID=A0A085GF66_9ENTR|nr:ABC transporter substrate-binding protein [Buttiauxella agrestis]KFC82361.1 periplasmic substrate-binding component of an ABC superfamily transporter [Buttiauxella agrestis ATCC 33320]